MSRYNRTAKRLMGREHGPRYCRTSEGIGLVNLERFAAQPMIGAIKAVKEIARATPKDEPKPR